MSQSHNDESTLRVPDTHAKEYLRRNERIALASSTVETYDSHLTEFVNFLNGRNTSVLDADFSEVRAFAEKCVRQGNRQSTIEGKLSTVGELYRYIHLRTDASQELSLDPLEFRDIDVSRYRTPEPIERVALSREEIRRLFDSFDSHRNRLMATVAVETGIRNSDLRNIRIQDMNLDECEIHVHNPKNSTPYDVPISEDLAFELDLWMRCHRRGFATAQESQYVFPSHSGVKLRTNGSLNKIITEAAERAGIQSTIGKSQITSEQKQAFNTDLEYRQWHRVTVHTLRHSCITLLEDAGVSLPYRQLVANHNNAETTQRYSHGGEDIFRIIREQFRPPR